jgi:hypothetical protein
MTYPILKTDKGTVIDFKNGIWKKGTFTGQTFRFINVSVLNHHSILWDDRCDQELHGDYRP